MKSRISSVWKARLSEQQRIIKGGNLPFPVSPERKAGETVEIPAFNRIQRISRSTARANFKRLLDFDSISSKAEDEANEFARNFLIDEEEYKRFIQAHKSFSVNDIKEFAKSVNVEPFIVLGRLQRDELVDWSEHQGLLKQYTWS